ncbi:MAG: hypothetical protein HY735_33315 [Verrucomicrobia bacterium]|nr:hypothetical protein [Verrucomicrobiota bacterium]
MNQPTPAPLPGGELSLAARCVAPVPVRGSRAGLSLLATAIFGLALLVMAGCTKEAAPPQPIAVEQAPTSLAETFKDAAPELKTLVTDAIGAFGAKDYPKALFALQTLSARSDLTPEQRDLATRSMLTVNQTLAEQASSGDQKAQQVLQFQRTTK